MKDVIIHISTPQDWEAAQQAGEYRVASLETEGFIHCSIQEQIERVANYHFSGQFKLLLLHLKTDQIKSKVKWEPAGDMLFPHIYGPLNLDAVISVEEFTPDTSGKFHYPQQS